MSRWKGLPLCIARFFLCHPRGTLEQQNKRQLAHKSKAPLCKGSWLAEGETEGLSLRKTYFSVSLRRGLPLPPLRGPPPPPRGGGSPLCRTHFLFCYPRGTLERCNKERSCTKVRLPCVKGAGLPKARLKDCSHAKDTFNRRKRNRLNPARKTVGAQTGGSH